MRLTYHKILALALSVGTLALFGCGGRERRTPPVNDSAPIRHPAPTPAATAITDVDWVLVELNGAAAQPAREPRARPRLKLDSREKRAAGSTGVNQFGGTFELTGEAVAFGPMMTTRRAGTPEMMEQESAFLDMFKRSARVQMRSEGSSLHLLDANERVLARFEPTVASVGPRQTPRP